MTDSMSETVHDKDIVAIQYKGEIISGLSNGTITGDL